MPESQRLPDMVARTRRRIEAAVDPDSALEILRAADRRRRRVSMLPVAVALVTAVFIGARLVASPAPLSPARESADPRTPPPITADPRQRAIITPSSEFDPPPDRPIGGIACDEAADSVCTDDRSVIVKTAGFTWTMALPRGDLVDVSTAAAPFSVDVFQRAAEAGVTVLVGVGRARTVSREETQDARALAGWVAARPFVDAGPVHRLTMSGYPAWRLDLRLDPEVRSGGIAEACNGFQSVCRPLLTQARGPDRWEVGAWLGMVSSFTFVDTPDAVTVVWSWSFEDRAPLADNARLIETLSFVPR